MSDKTLETQIINYFRDDVVRNAYRCGLSWSDLHNHFGQTENLFVTLENMVKEGKLEEKVFLDESVYYVNPKFYN